MNKKKKTIFENIFGDNDPRTKKGVRTSLVTAVATLLIVIGIVGIFRGFSNRDYYLTNNTTPIGTELRFIKSESLVKIKDVWTDKNREVTIVRISYDSSARNKLSTKGTNYNLYLSSDEKKSPDVDMEYGILNTEGDAFLFIRGDLKHKAYQVFIVNQVNLLNNSSDILSQNEIQTNEKSIEKEMSNYSINSVDDNGLLKILKGKATSPNSDILNFRINSYSNSTNVYQGSFLNKDNKIDYSKVVSITSSDSLFNNYQKKIEDKEKSIEQIENTISEYQSRLQENPDNTDVETRINQLITKLENENGQLMKLKEKLRQYMSEDFNKDSFGVMQEKFKYVDLESLKKDK